MLRPPSTTCLTAASRNSAVYFRSAPTFISYLHKVKLTYLVASVFWGPDQFLWTSNNPDWDGIVETSPQQALTVAGDGKDLGHIVFHYKNGDESWGWYSGSYKVVDKGDGKWEIPFSGEKYFLGGTGKFANIKGTLKYKGTVTPAGVTFTWEGELDY
jgi:hypothetical protein